ncbi:MAG: SDR family NAD(P)-dependent oxidoreductase, partial [Anaerolineae bacterium]
MKVALVTGGSRGIGLGIANRLAAEGWALVICGVRPAERVAETMAELRAAGADVHYCQADVSDREARARLIAATRERYGQLNVLVNNAGVAPRVRADILEATEESYDRVMNINLKGPYFLTQAAANWMVAQRRADPAYWGCIVNVSSISAYADFSRPNQTESADVATMEDPTIEEVTGETYGPLKALCEQAAA